MVYAVDDLAVDLTAGRSENHRAPVAQERRAIFEPSRGIHHPVHARVVPWNVRGIRAVIEGHIPSPGAQSGGASLGLVHPWTVVGIPVEQVRENRTLGHVVEAVTSNGRRPRAFEESPADAAEAVDADAHKASDGDKARRGRFLSN